MLKSDLDSVCAEVLDELCARGWEPGLTDGSYYAIVGAGFRPKERGPRLCRHGGATCEQSNTLRQLFYLRGCKALAPRVPWRII